MGSRSGDREGCKFHCKFHCRFHCTIRCTFHCTLHCNERSPMQCNETRSQSLVKEGAVGRVSPVSPGLIWRNYPDRFGRAERRRKGKGEGERPSEDLSRRDGALRGGRGGCEIVVGRGRGCVRNWQAQGNLFLGVGCLVLVVWNRREQRKRRQEFIWGNSPDEAVAPWMAG
jgi:hypothetical protein